MGPASAPGRSTPRRLIVLVLLDTTVLIDCVRGRPATDRVLKLRKSRDVPCTTAINIEELVRGLRSSEERVANGLIEGLLVIPLRAEEGRVAGGWRRLYSKRGRTLSQADCLVAAASVTSGATLATGNPKDFPMREARVEHWPVGE